MFCNKCVHLLSLMEQLMLSYYYCRVGERKHTLQTYSKAHSD